MCSMTSISKKLVSLVLILSTAFLAMSQVGCASGGYKLTRKLAQFVNKQQLVIRVVLGILTMPIFGVTLLIDAVVFNTMDFWEGRVSANEYSFEEGGKLYAVKHYYSGEQKLRNTEVRVFNGASGVETPESFLRISETTKGLVQVFENNQLKATVDSVHDLPQITLYENGKAKPWHTPVMISSH